MIRVQDKITEREVNRELFRVDEAIGAAKKIPVLKNADIPYLRQPEGEMRFVDSRDDKHYFAIRYKGENYFACAVKSEDVPEYTVSNGAADRTFDANQAAGSITDPPAQAEVENIRDAVLELADVVGTLISDLQSCGILK